MNLNDMVAAIISDDPNLRDKIKEKVAKAIDNIDVKELGKSITDEMRRYISDCEWEDAYIAINKSFTDVMKQLVLNPSFKEKEQVKKSK